MAKQLIVSVNGREKKIAIIEDDKVSEFYIERGEQHQGIVGNIYKGRVMRVLPGMQSAFVDIGLERDAFLYVTDFFDEEEEYERIVMDKSKQGDPAAEKTAKELIEKARLEREHRIESTQERVEPLVEAGSFPLEAAEVEEGEDEAAPEQQAEPASTPRNDRTEQESAGRRGRRGRRRGRGEGEHRQPVEAQESGDTQAAEELPVTPFTTGADDFQRLVDEDDTAVEHGAMFKDARVQEKIFDQIH